MEPLYNSNMNLWMNVSTPPWNVNYRTGTSENVMMRVSDNVGRVLVPGYISSPNALYAPEDSSNMFNGWNTTENIRNIFPSYNFFRYARYTNDLFYNCNKMVGNILCAQNALNTSNMYRNCYKVTGSPIINTCTTNASNMYANCNLLTGVPVFNNFSSGVNLSNCFNGCVKLSGNWNLNNDYYNTHQFGNINNMFANRSSAGWINITPTMNMMSKFNNGSGNCNIAGSVHKWQGSGWNIYDNNAKVALKRQFNWMMKVYHSHIPGNYYIEGGIIGKDPADYSVGEHAYYGFNNYTGFNNKDWWTPNSTYANGFPVPIISNQYTNKYIALGKDEGPSYWFNIEMRTTNNDNLYWLQKENYYWQANTGNKGTWNFISNSTGNWAVCTVVYNIAKWNKNNRNYSPSPLPMTFHKGY